MADENLGSLVGDLNPAAERVASAINIEDAREAAPKPL
jgi:hypothetical protein